MIAPTISPFDPRIVVEHCDMTGGYITHDNGLQWHMFNLRGGIQVSAFDPADPHVVYAANSGLWRSGDLGKSWKLLFPDPAKHTIEHQLGDHANYSLSSDDPAYPGGYITAMAITNGGEAATIGKEHLYLAFRRTDQVSVVVSSANGGASWSRLATMDAPILLLSPEASGLIAVAGSTVYRITLAGATARLSSVPTRIRAASGGRSGQSLWIYATGMDGEVYLSTHSGGEWMKVTPRLGQTAGHFEAIATSDHHPEISYAGFRDLQLGVGLANQFDGIAKTSDGGKNWKIVFKESTRAASNLTGSWIEQRATKHGESIFYDSPYSLGVAPNSPNVVYATDLFRTYRTLNAGASWQEMNSRQISGESWTSRGLDVTTNYGVQYDPFDSKHIFMDNTDIGLFRSTDNGRSWESSSDGVPEPWRNTAYWLAFDPSQRGLIWGAFSGTHDLPRPKMWRTRSPLLFTGGVAVSNDGGHHWQPSNTGLPSDGITHILLDPTSPLGSRTLYACAFGRGVYKSIDNGQSWIKKSDGIAGAEPFAWRITPSTDGSLYLVVARRSEQQDFSASGAGALYRSVDKAEHWQAMSLPAGVTGATGLQIDPRDPARLYLTAWGQEGKIADRNGGVFASDDRGVTWRPLMTQSQHVYDLTLDSRHPDTLYICGFDAAAYRSTDRGLHWARIEGYDFKWGHRVILDRNDPSQIFITTYGGGVWHGPAAGITRLPGSAVTEVPVAQ